MWSLLKFNKKDTRITLMELLCEKSKRLKAARQLFSQKSSINVFTAYFKQILHMGAMHIICYVNLWTRFYVPELNIVSDADMLLQYLVDFKKMFILQTPLS